MNHQYGRSIPSKDNPIHQYLHQYSYNRRFHLNWLGFEDTDRELRLLFSTCICSCSKLTANQSFRWPAVRCIQLLMNVSTSVDEPWYNISYSSRSTNLRYNNLESLIRPKNLTNSKLVFETPRMQRRLFVEIFIRKLSELCEIFNKRNIV